MYSSAIDTTDLPFPLVRRGKVRDVYDVGADRLLIVATDRISAFDVVMKQLIPAKGEVLTAVTRWWLGQGGPFQPNHLLAAELAELAEPSLAGRSMVVRRTTPVPFECVVRGYLSGSAWWEYKRFGTLASEPLPAGLYESDHLPEPLFSPATKAESGHDENVPFARVANELGTELADQLRDRSLAIYEAGRQVAESKGIIIADTKFEFGHDADGNLLLIDEVLTPDSSRFWPRDSYQPGRSQPSLDKQPVRDYLESLVAQGKWNKRPPAPDLPDAVIAETTARYRELQRRLTGKELS
ncbi:MAG: phosphoribosylaminoimidazolesuccinocarboxamide synthase [Gemmatimonadota bacterium]